ncbi:hydrogenase maturation nickel metallochaperone HypA/HybF [Streptacidiphilus fuscans]|uniref:Hydrogenase maturation factor HypA n=1 Tax=Streptacidiphilus fuscans TaxID=2789292 RepID=A0A931B1Z8_9ACTN|nr:hydrogenase maturation nickel metallochaperone HypA [Streptacidiphilus fuscans]MBF9068801.1 hydrogenase maturation nickel metallochaperone HypA [Streptacidiphilus fuscans]
MHEMSIALAVVDQVQDAARADRQGGARQGLEGMVPDQVTLRIGELAGVVPDALHFCFQLACEGTLLEGARLLTESVEGRAHCTPCDVRWPTGMPPDLCCPRCGSGASGLLAGRELEIAEVHWTEPGDRGETCKPADIFVVEEA